MCLFMQKTLNSNLITLDSALNKDDAPKFSKITYNFFINNE